MSQLPDIDYQKEYERLLAAYVKLQPKTEPSYRTEYQTTGKHTCPETGKDLTGWSAASIRAHAEDLFPGDPKDFGGEEARDRKGQLLKMAKESE